MKPTLGQKILQFPVTRIFLALLAVIIAIIGRDILMGFFPKASLPTNYIPQVWLGKIPKIDFVALKASVLYSIIAFIVLISLTFLLYGLYVHKVEKRQEVELERKKFLPEISLGIFIGSMFLLLVVGVLSLLGYFKIVETNITLNILPSFILAATAAFMEELLFRGIIFRIMEEKLGSWITIFFTSVLFGLLHGTNPGATLLSTLTISTSAGLVLGAAYILTRRLWLPIGIHFAVNAIQGGVFGTNVSGQYNQGIFISKISGPEIITGGDFGIESSVIVLVLGIVLSLILLYQANRKGKIIKPVWVKIKYEQHFAEEFLKQVNK